MMMIAGAEGLQQEGERFFKHALLLLLLLYGEGHALGGCSYLICGKTRFSQPHCYDDITQKARLSSNQISSFR